MTISVALIGTRENQLQRLESLLTNLNGTVSIARRLAYYPDPAELERMLRAVVPDILFLSTADPEQMEAIVRSALKLLPQLQIVLLDSEMRGETLRTAMQLDVRECLTEGFGAGDLREALERSMTRAKAKSSLGFEQSAMYSFLPAKPGVGSTTLAVQTALSLTQRSLLIDADLDAGIVKFLLQLRNSHSFTDAMEHVEQLDEHLWPQLVSEVGKLDVLHAGNAHSDYRMDLNRLQHVLSFARKQYSTILVDLPSSLNRLAVEFMSQSKMIFVVTTPEISSMHLARTRIRQFQDLQLTSQVRLVVNRVEKKGAIAPAQIGEALGMPVHFSFANDYPEVQGAFLAGKNVTPASALGRQISVFAESLAKNPVVAEAPRKRRFLEVFSLPR